MRAEGTIWRRCRFGRCASSRYDRSRYLFSRLDSRAARAPGFTLLEVLIALIVLALALLALTRTAALQVQALGELRERTLASWLAQEVLAETRLANPLPDPARNSGQRRFGGRDWRWEVEIQGTAVPSIRRIDVRIATGAAPRDAVVELSGFTGIDLAR